MMTGTNIRMPNFVRGKRGTLDPVQSQRIMHVDDDPVNRDITGRVLGQAGYIVYPAASIEEAEQELTNFKYALVICDGHLTPGKTGDGADFAAKLVASGTKAIIVSGDLSNQRRGVEFVLKPDWDIDRMVKLVKGELARP